MLSPLTKNKDVKLIKCIKVDKLIEDWNRIYSIDISSEMKNCPEVMLYECNQTRLRFFCPSNLAGSEKIYEKLKDFSWYYMPQKWEHDEAFRDLCAHRKILEVGCGKGAFINRLQKHGFCAEGIEMNPKAVEHAQNEGISVSLKNLQELLFSQSNQFDAVCSFQVLEHVSNPFDFIKNIIDLVKPGGKIIFAVPNANSFLKYQYNLLDMPPHHMTQWQLSTFEYLEKIFPVQLIRSKIEPLSLIHATGYFLAYQQAWADKYPLSQVLFNRFTLPVLSRIFRLAIRMGAGRFFAGQSLYVCFEKV